MRELVNPREIWRREDEDFSPWLAKNLNLLDDILDTQLNLIGLERSVGPFFADILCLNKVDNSNVVIENQLEMTDHKHLGQLLTYAAGLKAHTIIWIATKFEYEHRDALEWLNDNMKNHFRFFGVELELKPIDNSRCEPKFTLIAKPRNRNRQRFVTRNTTYQQDTYCPPTEYWSEFEKYYTSSGLPLVPLPPEANNDNYYGFYIKDIEERGFWVAAWRPNNGTRIAVNFHLNGSVNYHHVLDKMETVDALTVFNTLMNQRKDIEDAFGGPPLKWQPSPRFLSPGPLVGLYTGARADKTDWSRQFEWMCRNLEKLSEAFRPQVLSMVSRI